jgi:hypothetical protein
MVVDTLLFQTAPEVGAMAPKKKQEAQGPEEPGQVQISFRVDTDFKQRLVQIARKKGLDLTNLVRSIVYEAIRPYENQTGS